MRWDKLIIAIIFIVLLVTISSGEMEWSPFGNIELFNYYSIKNPANTSGNYSHYGTVTFEGGLKFTENLTEDGQVKINFDEENLTFCMGC